MGRIFSSRPFVFLQSIAARTNLLELCQMTQSQLHRLFIKKRERISQSGMHERIDLAES